MEITDTKVILSILTFLAIAILTIYVIYLATKD